MKSINLTTIQFPEIKLQTRDAFKLRGYFGTLFKEHSPLLHNHYENGELRHRYPLVQYKVLNSIPTLVALEEGAELLIKLFLKIDGLNINGNTHEIGSKNIKNNDVRIGYSEELRQYSFKTMWMALNQKNFKKYYSLDKDKQTGMLNKILVGNVLSFFKQMDLFLEPDERLMAKTFVHSKKTQFKGQKMTVFQGDFIINADLSEYIGLGKAVSMGFGSISTKSNPILV